MFDFLFDKKFLGTALSIAIPIALQNIVNTSINLVDTLMVATLDAESVAATGICNNVFVFWNTLSFGIISGGTILVSQYFGAANFTGIRKTYGLTLIVDIIGSLFFFIPALFFTRPLMALLTNQPNLITTGVKYLKIVCVFYPIHAFTLTTLLIIRSLGKLRITIASSFITLLSNLFLDYALIGGHFGFPAMGVEGAAIATVISRIIEATIIFIYLFATKSVLIEKLKELFAFKNKDYLKTFFKTTIGTAADEFVFGLGIALFFVAYGRLTASEVSAVSASLVLHDLLITFSIGFCSACSICIGIELGQNHIEEAKDYAKKYIKLFFLLSVILTAVLLIIKVPYISLYRHLGDTVTFHMNNVINTLAFILFAGNLSFVFIVGILRAGGDIKPTVIIDLVTCWFIGVPLAFLGVKLKLPVHIVFFLANFQEVMKTLFGYIRYKQYKWVNNLVKEI